MKKLLFLIALAFCFIPAHAGAASTPAGITVSPFLQNIAVDPNAPATSFNFSVTNNTTYSQVLRLSVVDFGSLDETGGVAFAGANESTLMKKYGLSTWLTLDRPEVSLKAGEKADIVASIRNEATLAPGGHYAAILVSTTASGEKNSVNLQQTVSSLVLANKLGGVSYGLHLDRVSQNGSLLHPPNKVVLRFKNTGNVHIVPRGTVKLIDNQNRLLSTGVINEDSDFILPETYRQIFIDLKGVSPIQRQIVKTYKLQVDYRYDGIERYASKTYTIRWINWPLIILMSLVLGLAIGSVVYALRMFHRQRPKR